MVYHPSLTSKVEKWKKSQFLKATEALSPHQDSGCAKGNKQLFSRCLKKLRKLLKLQIITLEPKDDSSMQRRTVGRKQGWE